MAFTSFHFLVFFPVVLALYFALPHRYRWLLLLSASCYFYMAWKAEFIVLLLGATGVSYVGALMIESEERPARRRAILAGCMLLLIGVLFVFKYFNFFNESARTLLDAMGISYGVPAVDLLLPLGISFFTFQKIAYLVDVYQRKFPAERHLGIFSVFTTFFPQLVAGPIERAANLLPQFRKEATFDYARICDGLRLMAWGFFKKVVVADRLAPFVNAVYSSPREHDGATLMAATVMFAFQVYCDFSAYSDIAIGAARTMGIKLSDNFRQPYFSTSIGEFWKRWHISLSSWLTDYVYTPLTRSSAIKLDWYPKFLLALLLTFLVSGLWHGANWTFVAWGALHGTYLISSVLTQKLRKRIVTRVGLDHVPRLHTAMRVAMTFSLVCLTYVFFRAASISDAVYIVTHLFHGLPHFLANIGDLHTVRETFVVGGSVPAFIIGMLGVVTVVIADAYVRYGGTFQIVHHPVWFRWPAYYSLVLATVMLGAFYDNAQTFIYFQF